VTRWFSLHVTKIRASRRIVDLPRGLEIDVGELVSLDDQLNHAFRLAYFLLGNRVAALRVAATAVARVEVALASQERRLYYRLTGGPRERKAKAERFRNRVSYDELQVLQRQVYVESEPYEREMEHAAEATGLNERDLLVFFVKHLVRITIKRNSFYVTLGATRLLRNYTTSEAMDFYTAIIQDPDRLKDDYYFRSRKGVLMKELKERFGDLVKVQKGPHGEERWQAKPHSDETHALVEECFEHFTPWRTLCPISDGVDPRSSEIDDLCSRNGSSEDTVEVRRIHAALHAECIRRLSQSLGFGDPRMRLEVPQFALATNGEPPRGRRAFEPLTSDERAAIHDFLENQADRRKRAPVAVLRVFVDGTERAQLDPSASRNVAFPIDEDSERFEVLTEVDGDDVVLASHFFARSGDETLRLMEVGIRLEAGQEIRLVIGRDVVSGFSIADLEYRETGLARRAALCVRRLRAAVQDRRSPWRLIEMPGVASSAMAAVVIALLVAGTLLYSTPTGELIVSQPAPPSSDNANESVASQNNANDNTQVPAPRATDRLTNAQSGPPQVAGSRPNRVRGNPLSGTDSDREITRGKTRAQGLELQKVRTIFVEVHGAPDELIGASLHERLRATSRLLLATDRERADALLEVSVIGKAPVGPEGITLTVRLLNADGGVIWPVKRYTGLVPDIASRVVRDLGAAAAAADRIPSTPQRTSP
jgi:hypothetical protein